MIYKQFPLTYPQYIFLQPKPKIEHLITIPAKMHQVTHGTSSQEWSPL